MSHVFVVVGPDGYWAGVDQDGLICSACTQPYQGFEYSAALGHPPVATPPADAQPAVIRWEDFDPVRRRVPKLLGRRSEFGRRLYGLLAEAAGDEQARQAFGERLEALLRSRIQEPGETRCQICDGDTTCPAGVYEQVRAPTYEEVMYTDEYYVPGYRCTHLRRGRYWQMRLVDDQGWRLYIIGWAQSRRVYAHYGVEAIWCGQIRYAIYAVPADQDEPAAPQ